MEATNDTMVWKVTKGYAGTTDTKGYDGMESYKRIQWYKRIRKAMTVQMV